MTPETRALLQEAKDAFEQIIGFTSEHGGAAKAIKLCRVFRARIENALKNEKENDNG
jgi:hypothetical protein